jgi:hypothetical protein
MAKMKGIKKMSDYNISEINFLSRSALEIFEQRAANLLASLDATSVYTAIATFMRLEGIPENVKANFNLDSLLKTTQRAFLTLLQRKALDSFVRFPISPEGQEELDRMNAEAYDTGADADNSTPTSTAPSATPEQLLEALVVEDWRTLPAADIRKKKATVPGYAAAVERVVESGQI